MSVLSRSTERFATYYSMNTAFEITRGPELQHIRDVDCDRSRIGLDVFPGPIPNIINTTSLIILTVTYGIRICNAATGWRNNNVKLPKSV